MNAIFGLLNIIPGAVWFAMCAGLFGWGGINQYRINSAQAQIATIRADQATAVSEAQRRASAMTRNLQETKDAAIAKAEKRAEENRVAAAGARTELERLRKQSASGAGNAGTSHAACVEYASTATDVLNECGSALQELAAAADGHVSDIRTLTGSWPAWDKFASEMTDFTNRLKGQQ